MPYPYRPTGELIIGGRSFQVDAPVVTWRTTGWDATSINCIPTKTEAMPPCTAAPGGGWYPYGNLPFGKYISRYSTRPALRTAAFNGGLNPTYEAAKAVIKKFVIHTDGCADADMCWNVLQNERGLSVHFLLDNDGTIYQTIDLALMSYHASEWNVDSIGVELCSRGDVKSGPDFYKRRGVDRPTAPCRINGNTILSWEYMPAQYEAMEKLSRALLRLLPNIPAEYPQSSPGVQVWDTLPYSQTFGFTGYLGHYHLTSNKWDPGPFDFKKFCGKLRGALAFPVFPKGAPEKDPTSGTLATVPAVPAQSDELKAATELLYKLNEAKADGGFFPIGPWGEARLWHGGVHLAGTEGAQVFAPFPARIVAMRMGASNTGIGSVNFVLLRHQMALGDKKVEFYSLYMHLADELTAPKPVEWLEKAKFDDDKKPRELKAGEVILLDLPVEAGALLGRMGKAGPADLSRTQIHFEIFATTEIFDNTPSLKSPWQFVDGTTGGRFSDVADINSQIDQNKDNILQRSEVTSFFNNGSGTTYHNFVVRHTSEWTPEPSWAEALKQQKDFHDTKPEVIDQMVAEQITPGLWWTDKVAAHCRLPSDGVVFHYHPIKFVSWFNQKLIEAAEEDKTTKVDAKDAKETKELGITDDFGDKDGSSMRSSNEFVEDPCNTKLTLKELVQGYDAPECGP